MNSSSLILLLVVLAILILGIALIQQPARRRRKGQAGRRRRLLRKMDHGARIARLHGRERSPQWARVAREHRRREPACVACGHKGIGLQVHHIKPFHLHPHLELDPNNLITLCEVPGRNHHLLLGHLDAWQSYNEHVREDAKRLYRKNARQIKADSKWQKRVLQRP